MDLAVLSEESTFLKTQKNNSNSENQKSCIKKHLKFEIQHFFANAFQTTLPPRKVRISCCGRSPQALLQLFIPAPHLLALQIILLL